MVHNLDYLKQDQEMMRMVEELEKEGLLKAPPHIRENVMKQVSIQSRHTQNRRLLIYRTQVFAGMAAALIALVFLPEASKWQLPQIRISEKYSELLPVSKGDSFEQIFSKKRNERNEDWQSHLEKMENREKRREYVDNLIEKYTTTMLGGNENEEEKE